MARHGHRSGRMGILGTGFIQTHPACSRSLLLRSPATAAQKKHGTCKGDIALGFPRPKPTPHLEANSLRKASALLLPHLPELGIWVSNLNLGPDLQTHSKPGHLLSQCQPCSPKGKGRISLFSPCQGPIYRAGGEGRQYLHLASRERGRCGPITGWKGLLKH